MGRGRVAAAVTALGFVLVGCTSHHDDVTTETVEVASIPPGANGPEGLAQRLTPSCPNDGAKVVLVLTDSKVRITFACTSVLHDPELLARQAVDAVAERHHAAARADAEIRIEQLLHLHSNDRDAVIWDLGTSTSDQGWRCDHAGDVANRKQQLSQRGAEPLDHWLEVEAAYLAGWCPNRLDDLYQTVTKLGLESTVAKVDPLVESRDEDLRVATFCSPWRDET